MKLETKHRKRRSNIKRLFGAVLLACLIAISSSGMVFAADEYQFSLKFGTTGSGDGQFSLPIGVAVDSSGNVYVADFGNYRIQKFDSSGAFVSQIGGSGTGDGQFSVPYDIAVDSSGNIYVVDEDLNRVQKFDSSGAFVTKWGSTGTGDGQFTNPTGICLDSSGNVYVAERTNNRIQKFDSNGTFISKFGTSGTGDGQFNASFDVAVDTGGNIYVTDSSNHRIQKFNPAGVFVAKWGKNSGDGTSGDADGQFNGPSGISIDASNNIYVADYYNHRIQKLSSSGTFISKFGSFGSGDGQFARPIGIAVSTNGKTLFVSDYYSRVQKLVKTDAGYLAGDKSWLTFDRIKKTNTAENNITSNLELVTSAPNGSVISWASNNLSVIGTDGKVTRPPFGNSDAGVTVTATLTKGSLTDTKAFSLNVKAATEPATTTSTPEPTSTATVTCFTDVPSGAWYKSFVDTLVGKKIISGYADNSFRPGNSVTRAEFSKMLGLALGWTIKTPTASSFSDVPVGNWASPYIEAAKLKGALSGYPDGTFNPNKPITRAEIAAIIARVKGYASTAAAFTDTNEHWANGSIGACSKAGILSGYPGGTFRPDGPANRAEAAKLIAALL